MYLIVYMDFSIYNVGILLYGFFALLLLWEDVGHVIKELALYESNWFL